MLKNWKNIEKSKNFNNKNDEITEKWQIFLKCWNIVRKGWKKEKLKNWKINNNKLAKKYLIAGKKRGENNKTAWKMKTNVKIKKTRNGCKTKKRVENAGKIVEKN